MITLYGDRNWIQARAFRAGFKKIETHTVKTNPQDVITDVDIEAQHQIDRTDLLAEDANMTGRYGKLE